jgi:hypothetical protein
MTKKDHNEAPRVGRPSLSGEGRRVARAKSERQAAALRENLLKRKHQQRGRGQTQAPPPTER